MNRNSHGRDIFETMRDLPEVFEIVGYAIVEDERETCADRLDVFSGYPEMTVEEILADGSIEAVTVETDEIHLTKYATLAIRAGKHIHMEKPGSPSLPDFEELIRAAKETGRVLHLGYMYRYNAAVSELIERVRRGELGRIICTEAQMNCIHTREVREWLTAFPGGMTFFLGCHLIDLVLQIQGEPLRITPYNKVSGKDGTAALRCSNTRAASPSSRRRQSRRAASSAVSLSSRASAALSSSDLLRDIFRIPVACSSPTSANASARPAGACRASTQPPSRRTDIRI